MRALKIRSMVGLIPLFAVETLEPELLQKVPGFTRRLEWFLKYRPDLAALVSHWSAPGRGSRRLLSLLRGHRMKGLLRRMLDEVEFLSSYGVRALSRSHADNPYVFRHGGAEFTVRYQWRYRPRCRRVAPDGMDRTDRQAAFSPGTPNLWPNRRARGPVYRHRKAVGATQLTVGTALGSRSVSARGVLVT